MRQMPLGEISVTNLAVVESVRLPLAGIGPE